MSDPPGVWLERDSNGELHVRVADKALDLVLAKIPNLLTRDDHRREIAPISKIYASHDITSACETDTSPDDVQAYRNAGKLLYHDYCLMGVAYLERYIAAALHTGFGDSLVRIGASEQYADSPTSERTGWLREPYVGILKYRELELDTRGPVREIPQNVTVGISASDAFPCKTRLWPVVNFRRDVVEPSRLQ
jgi:predicted amidohydrolase YtcJ